MGFGLAFTSTFGGWYNSNTAAPHSTSSKSTVAYYGVDLALSGYGLAAKSTTLKAPVNAWNKLPHARRFKLFRYSSEDYLRGYQAMRKPALGIEMGADYSSIKAIRDSYD